MQELRKQLAFVSFRNVCLDDRSAQSIARHQVGTETILNVACLFCLNFFGWPLGGSECLYIVKFNHLSGPWAFFHALDLHVVDCGEPSMN